MTGVSLDIQHSDMFITTCITCMTFDANSYGFFILEIDFLGKIHDNFFLALNTRFAL